MELLAAVNLRDEVAEHVVEASGRWASALGAQVDLLYVDESQVPGWLTDPISTRFYTRRLEDVRAQEADRLRELHQRIPEAARRHANRAEGPAAETIAQVAAGYDALILAGRQRTALGRMLLGSVAAKVVRRSPVPVLVIPAGAQPGPGDTPRLLLGVDLRAELQPGMSEAQTWAEHLGGRLDLVHIDDARVHVPYILDPELRRRFEREWSELRARDKKALDGRLSKLPEAIRGEARLAEGDPATTLCELGREADLLVVATQGRKGMARFFLGSVAEKVLTTCERPVLLVPPRGAPSESAVPEG